MDDAEFFDKIGIKDCLTLVLLYDWIFRLGKVDKIYLDNTNLI